MEIEKEIASLKVELTTIREFLKANLHQLPLKRELFTFADNSESDEITERPTDEPIQQPIE